MARGADIPRARLTRMQTISLPGPINEEIVGRARILAQEGLDLGASDGAITSSIIEAEFVASAGEDCS